MEGRRQKAEGVGRMVLEVVPAQEPDLILAVRLDGREVGHVDIMEGCGPFSCRAVLGGVAYLLPSIEGHGETPRGAIADAVRAAREDADALLTWAAEVEAALVTSPKVGGSRPVFVDEAEFPKGFRNGEGVGHA